MAQQDPEDSQKTPDSLTNPGVEGVLGLEADDAEQPEAAEYERAAIETLRELFDTRRQEVFFSRQIEVMHEAPYFHWVTKRALKTLEASGIIRSEKRDLTYGGTITLFWHQSYRYYKRDAAKVVSLVNEYANPNMGAALGIHAELLVLEGFASKQFLMQGRETRSYRSKEWTRTEHDLDFIFERDGIGYGVEVKNTLGYMDHGELRIKMEICRHLGIRPVFAVRMLPKDWTMEVIRAGGYALIMKYQLYPPTHKDLAKKVSDTLGLPVDAPRALRDSTVGRLLRWHLESLPA